MATLLITGFEGFLGRQANPSWDHLPLMLSLHPELRGEVALLRLPVLYDSAPALLEAAIIRHKPAAVLSFGMHGGQESGGRSPRGFYVERLAHNLDDAPAADNAGEVRKGRPIDRKQAAGQAVEGTLPPEVLFAGLRNGGAEAAMSDNAGRYLCNHVYYHAVTGGVTAGAVSSGAITGSATVAGLSYKPRPLAGFVHVPPDREMRADGPPAEFFCDVYAALARHVLAWLAAEGAKRG